MSYQTLVQGDRIAFATQQGASLNQIAIITTDIPSRSTIYFANSNIFRQDGTLDTSQAVMAIDVFNKTVRVGSTYISSGGGIVEADLVSTTVALLAGAGSGGSLSILQLTSTVIGASVTNAQLNNTLTSTVTGQFVTFTPVLQAGLSSLGLFTSNTSNYYKNNLVNYSTTISSISTSVGATSNWSLGAFQDWSTPVSTVSTAAGQTSNWSRGTLQNWSTPLSTVALFTSNTSNWASNIQQNWSSAVSIATLYTSNTSNYAKNLLQDYSTPVSTVALYTSNTSNWAANIQQNWSSAVSTATLFTSNTSNWSKNMLQDYSTAVSTVALFTSNSSNYFMANAGGSGTSSLLGVISSGFSTLGLFTSNTSNWSRGLLQDYSTPVSSISTTTGQSSNWSRGLLQDYSTPVSSVSSVVGATSNYFTPLLANNYSTNLQSTVAGLGTAGYISTGQFLSSMIGINSNISSMIDPVELASSVVGLGTVGFVSAIGLTAILNSTVVGVNTYVSSMIDPVELTSSIIGLGAAGFISTVGLDNRLASTVFGVNSNMYSTTSGTSTQIANVYQFSRGFLQDFSTPVSSISTVSGLTSNWSKGLLQDYSTPVSSISTVSGLTSNWSKGLLQDYSTPVSSVSTTAGQTSNWSRNLLQDYSTPVSTVFFYSRNLLQDFSTPVSSVSLFTSNTSNYAKNILQDWSTPVNTLNLFTQNTSNYAKNILQDWSTPVSTVALYTSNTSNWASNIQQNWSSAVSVATLYTSNTSNWAKNAQQDWSTPVSTVALYASNTSNWASNIQQNWSSAVSIATLYTSNTSNWSRNMLQDYSTPISSVIFYTRNILQDWSTPVSTISTTTGQSSNWSRNMLQDYSTPVSTVFFYSRNLLQDFSTPVSSVSTTTGQSSNWSRNMLQDYSTPISSVIFYTKNILQDWSTPVSSVSTAAGATSNWSRGAFQDFSTPVSSLSTYTGTASNWSRGILQDWSTPVNTVMLYTQNTSNWARGMLQDWSTPITTATQFTSNTSNFLLPALSNNYSTNLASTVDGLGTANYISAAQLYSTVTGVIFNGSTNTLSASRIFTSSLNAAFVTASGTVSAPQLIVSSINGQTLAQLATVPIQSTAMGLGTLGYISSTQLASTQAYLLAVTSTGLSTVALFTSNTSNYSKNILQDWSTPALSTTAGLTQGLGSANYISASQLYSTVSGVIFNGSTNTLSASRIFTSSLNASYVTATQGYISSLVIDSLQLGFNNAFFEMGDVIANSLSTLQVNTGTLAVSGTVCTPQIMVSTINGQTLSQLATVPIQSTAIGLGTLGYISTAAFLSSMLGITNNISSMIDPVELASSIVGLGTVGFVSSIGLTAIMNSTVAGVNTYVSSMIDPVELTSTITGLGASGFISTIGLDAKLASTVQGLGSATYISAAQLYSTVAGIGAMAGSTLGISTGTIGARTLSSVQGYISSFRTDSLTVGGPTGYVNIQDLNSGTISTGQLVAGAGFISSLQINTLSFGPSGYIIVSDVIANSLSTKKLNTQNLYANNVYVGNNSTQSMILFPGIDGNFKGTAIGEQTTGVGTEELLLYKVSTTTDQIRMQTTGNLVFEAGVSARSWPSTQMVATPTLFIQGSTSNVGIGTATPQTTLDVAGTGRFVTVSTLNVNLSTINGQTITQLIATPLQSTVAGLGTATYISSAQLLSTQAYLLAVTSTGLSSVALFTSNTSNYAKNILQDWSTATQSTVAGLGTATYISAAQLYSTVTGVIFNGSTNTLSSARIFTSSLNSAFVTGTQGYISSLVVDSLAIGSNSGFINMGDIITTSHSTLQINTGIFTASGTVCTPQIVVSSINGQTLAQLATVPIQSTAIGLGTLGYISSSQLASTQAYLLAVTSTGLSSVALFTSNTSNYARNLLQDYSTSVSTVALFTSNTSNWSRGLLQDYSTPVSSVALFTSNTSNWSRNLLQDFSTPVSSVSTAAGATSNWSRNLLQDYSTPVSTVSTFTGNTSNWARNLLQDISTPVSSLSTLYGTRITSLSAAISTLTLQNFTSLQGSVSSLQVNSLLIGTGTGSINLGDTVMTAVSSVSTATNTLYALNTFLGNVSSQTAIQFYGLTGQYNGTAIAEKLVSPGVQELLLYKASSIQDQIRLQTTGNIVFEAGVAGRSWSTSTAAPTPTLYISYLSNVGIGTAAPATTLDVAGTGRFQTVSTLALVTSSINGQTVAQLATLPIQSTVIGLGLAGYISSTQLASTQAYLLAVTSTGLSTLAIFTSNTSNYARGFLQDFSTPVSSVSTAAGATSNYARGLLQDYSTPVSSVGLFTSNTSNYARNLLQDWSTPVSTVALFTSNTSNYARNILQDWSTATQSTVAGLGSASYISATQLYSTVAGITFSGSTNTLSASRIFTSSLNAAYVTATQGYISSLVVDSLQLGFNNAFFEMGDVIATSLSTLQVNTGVLTTSGVICTPQIIVSTINGAAPVNAANITSTVAGLGTSGYISSFVPVYVSLSTAALFTSNTSNYARNLLQDFSTPTTNTSNFFVPLLANNYSTNLTSTVAGLGTAGYISTASFLSSMLGMTSNISSMIDPVELASTVVGLGTVGFTSSIGLTAILNSTVAGVNTYVSSMIDPVELASSITSLGTQGFISSIGFDAKLASTTAGLGTATYISATQLYSTVAGITFSGSTNTLSASRIFTSSINAAFVTGTQGYISSLVVDSLAIGSNSGFINMGDIITTSHSTLQINTGVFTASGTVCAPQIIVSSINGATPLVAANITSSIVGLGTAGYLSSVGPLYGVVSSGLSTVATFTSNTSNFFLPALSNNYSTNLQSTFAGLATGGYISSSQLFSTVTALTGSTLSLSAGSVFASSIQTLRLSTAQAAVCTVTFQDQLAGNPMGNVYQYSSILYYNSFVVAGTTAMNIQSFTF